MAAAGARGPDSAADRARAGLLAIPGLRLVRTYDRSWLPTDALAALTVWALLVPQALAYAQLGGFDPVVGLYASIGALAGYVLLGGVREMNVGPEATIALLAASGGAWSTWSCAGAALPRCSCHGSRSCSPPGRTSTSMGWSASGKGKSTPGAPRSHGRAGRPRRCRST
jgi:hypothetical protein